MSALITSVEHASAVAAQDVVKTDKFVETSVLPALKQVQANGRTLVLLTAVIDRDERVTITCGRNAD